MDFTKMFRGYFQKQKTYFLKQLLITNTNVKSFF